MAKGRSLWAAKEPINHSKDMGPIVERPDPAHIKYMFLKNEYLRKSSKTQILVIKARPTTLAQWVILQCLRSTKHTSFDLLYIISSSKPHMAISMISEFLRGKN